MSRRTDEAAPRYLTSLTVENVRCFGPAQTLDLTGPDGKPARWTVILGENGVGKSTLLQSIIAVQPVQSGDSDRAASRYHTDTQLFSGTQPNWFERTSDGSSRVSSRYVDSLETTTKDSDPQAFQSEIEIEANGGTRGHRVVRNVGSAFCVAYGANRIAGRDRSPSENDVSSAITLFDEAARLPGPEEWLIQLDNSANRSKDPSYRRLFETFKDLLVQVLPDVDDIVIRQPDGIFQDPIVEAQTPYGRVPFSRLGLGYRSMIAWMADLTARLFKRSLGGVDTLHQPVIVLVDEIDLHMHPRWQRDIMAYLSRRFRNAQFIVTAHSPLIIQAAADANIAVLKRSGDHVEIDNDPAIVRNWRVDQLLTSDLFGLDSARPPALDGLLEERERLLRQSKLSAADRKRVDELEEKIGFLPGDETAEQRKAWDIIERAARRLEPDDAA